MSPFRVLAPSAAVVNTIHEAFKSTDYYLDEVAAQVGRALAPTAWAKLVSELGERTALDIFGAFVLEVIGQEASRLTAEAQAMEDSAQAQRRYAAALLSELNSRETMF